MSAEPPVCRVPRFQEVGIPPPAPPAPSLCSPHPRPAPPLRTPLPVLWTHDKLPGHRGLEDATEGASGEAAEGGVKELGDEAAAEGGVAAARQADPGAPVEGPGPLGGGAG